MGKGTTMNDYGYPNILFLYFSPFDVTLPVKKDNIAMGSYRLSIFVYLSHNNGNQTTESLGKMIPPLFFINAIICAVFFIFKYFVCHTNESRV